MRWVLSGAILLLAASLRFAALDFGGTGFSARPDENGVLLTVAAMEKGQALPPFVLYGGGYFGPLREFMRLWGAVVWDDGLAGRAAVQDLDAMRAAARAWSALLALATVGIVFAVGARVRGAATGLLAASLLAVLPLAVREAHFAKPDTAAAAAAALVMASCVLPRAGGRRRSLLIGTAAALAISTKALMSAVPGAAFALAWPDGAPSRRVDWPALGWAALVCLAACLLLNLPLLRQPAVTLATAKSLLRALSDPGWLPGADLVPGPFVYHATVSLRWGCGLAIAVLALPALVFGLASGGSLRVIALLVLGHAIAVQASPMVLARFFLPALPGLAVLVAAMLVTAVERSVAAGRMRAAALAGVAMLVLAEPAVASVRLVRLLGRADTRTLAGDWIQAHLPPEARVVSWGAPGPLVDFGCPPLSGRWSAPGLAPELWRAKGATVLVWHRHPLPYSSRPLPGGSATLRSLAVFDPLASGAAPVLEPLDAFYLPLGRFDGVERPGPRIEIFAIDY